MKILKFLSVGETDSRVDVSIVSPKSTIITTIVIMIYSMFLVEIFRNISFNPDNAIILTASILALIIISSICIAVFGSYIHYLNYTKPILYLANAAKEVAKGNYSVQLPPHRNDGKIDEIEALYIDFNEMVTDLSSTEILRSSFISNISHELKTPIAVISNYSRLMCNENITASEQKDYALKIQDASANLSELITNILQISKLDNNQIKANIEDFDISEEMVRCILGFETILDEKDIDLQIDMKDGIRLRNDAGLIKIVINNILSNAIKFTPEKGIIKISLKDENEQISMSISDSGCGMDEETMKHIFDKFYQGDTSHATRGNGLGLAMVKQIIALLNGSINVKSSPGEGSTFTVVLPNL